LRELIQAAEQRMSCRPRRRVELVQERLEALEIRVARYRSYLSRQEQARQKQQERQGDLQKRLEAQEKLLASLESKQGDKPVRPYSRLAKARQQKQSWQRQFKSSQRQEEIIRGKIARHRARIGQLLHPQIELDLWHATLLIDNATNPNPVI
jgi:chromosome segregation ATPase